MKKIFVFLFLSSLSISYAQSISDYKYVIIPDKFSDFDENQFRLNFYLKNLMTKKNYEILTENVQDWPAEVQLNACLAATVDVKKEKSFLKNKLEIIFRDCQENEIAKLNGESSIKEFDKGYQDAMKNAVQNMKIQNAKPIEEIHQNTEISANISNTQENKIVSKSSSNLFSNGIIKLTKTDLTDGSFLLINEETAQVYAQFFSSSKTGIYRVKVMDAKGNYETIGYFDGNKLEIEMNSADNKAELIQFKSIKD